MARGKEAKGDGSKREAAGGKSQGTDSIDSLYQLPLTEFTPARNALSTRLRKGGKTAEAEEIKTLVKPSIPAWAVNQVYWKHRSTFDRMIAAGDQLRKAQASTLAGRSGDVRAALESVRETLSELSRLAADRLHDVGHNATPGVMRAVHATLEALSAYGSVAGAPQAGRLVDEVDPPGFETLAALVPNSSGAGSGETPSRVLKFTHTPKPPRRHSAGEKDEKRLEEERKAQLAAAKAAAQEAERSLRDAKATAQQAQTSLKKAAANAKDTEQAMVEAEAVMERTAKEAHTARQLARRLAVEAEAAAQAVEDAERALTRAKKEVEDVKG